MKLFTLKIRDNYSKPTYGMVRFHFTYPWFKTLHFVHLNFNLLPTSPSDVRKTPCYSKLEHNTDQKHELKSFCHKPYKHLSLHTIQ